jgi:hypothetical protein
MKHFLGYFIVTPKKQKVMSVFNHEGTHKRIGLEFLNQEQNNFRA